jgi:putative ABC transport system permease protein
VINFWRLILRHVRHHPGFASVTILVLGLGIAAATVVYSIVDAVVLRPLPYVRPDRLVTIWDANAEQALSHDPISPVNFMDQRSLPVFADAAAWWRPGVNLVDPGLDPIRVNTIEVSGNLFEVLGVSPQVGPGFPARGPLFVPNEPIAVISDRLWRSRYAADPSVVGKQLLLNGTPHTIAGVMPARFHFPDDVDVWQRLIWDMTQHSRSAHFMEAVARLSDGTRVEEAQAAVDALWTRIERDFAGTRNSPGQGWRSRLVPLLDEQLGYYRPALFVLFGSVGLLLVIAVLNVASLMLTRSLAREREIAVRVALGASTRQIVRQLLAEGFVLSLGGALLGIAAAAAAVPLIVALTPVQVPRLEDAAINWRAVALALGIGGGATLVFGAVPGWLVIRRQMIGTLRLSDRGTSRGAQKLYMVLVAGEVALACALLVSSALLVRTVGRMVATPTGVEAAGTVITPLQLTRNSASRGTPRDQWQAIANIQSRIYEAIRQQPGVHAAGASNFLPLEIGWRMPFALPGQPPPARPEDAPQAQLHSVSEGYFEAMGATLSSGRFFTAFDGVDGAPVVIVNEAFARRYFANAPAVGSAIGLRAGNVGPLGVNLMPPAVRTGVEVVGVVADVRNVPLGQTSEPAMYVPLRQFPFSDVFVAVKAESTSAAVAAVRSAVRTAAPEVPVGASRTWGDRFGDRTAEPRLLMTTLMIFGFFAALLAALGVYGLMSWSVALRTRELSIRLALGAKPAAVGWDVIRRSSALAVTGLIIGLAIVRGAERLLSAVLYEVSSSDVRATAAAGALLLAAALVACVPPAVRAMRVAPVEGLRAE